VVVSVPRCPCHFGSARLHTRGISFDAAGLKAFRTRLAAVGGVEWKINASEGDSVYFLDPDGHRLEAHVGDLISRLISLQHAPYDRLEIFGDISHTPVSAATEDPS